MCFKPWLEGGSFERLSLPVEGGEYGERADEDGDVGERNC